LPIPDQPQSSIAIKAEKKLSGLLEPALQRFYKTLSDFFSFLAIYRLQWPDFMPFHL